MKFVDPNAEIIDIRDPLERIERIGRICYKSEDKIGPGTAKKFVKMLIQRKHYAMLEHAHVHYKVEAESLDILLNIPGVIVSKLAGSDWLVTVSVSHLFNPKYESICLIWQMYVLFYNEYLAEDGDIPTSIEFDDVQLLSDKLLKAHKHEHELVSICFTCDRGVSHELVRHRCAVAQESTRYCNYSSDKFGSEIRVVVPSTFADWDESSRACWTAATNASEQCYLAMIENGRKPQEARSVLNNSLATQVVLSMTPDRWEHFFDLRSRGTTGAPHPDMKVVADIALEKYNKFLNK